MESWQKETKEALEALDAYYKGYKFSITEEALLKRLKGGLSSGAALSSSTEEFERKADASFSAVVPACGRTLSVLVKSAFSSGKKAVMEKKEEKER